MKNAVYQCSHCLSVELFPNFVEMHLCFFPIATGEERNLTKLNVFGFFLILVAAAGRGGWNLSVGVEKFNPFPLLWPFLHLNCDFPWAFLLLYNVASQDKYIK